MILDTSPDYLQPIRTANWKTSPSEAKKVEQSVNKIKKAVDTEVKEKFNTKSTDAKDIFNELFGEKKW